MSSQETIATAPLEQVNCVIGNPLDVHKIEVKDPQILPVTQEETQSVAQLYLGRPPVLKNKKKYKVYENGQKIGVARIEVVKVPQGANPEVWIRFIDSENRGKLFLLRHVAPGKPEWKNALREPCEKGDACVRHSPAYRLKPTLF